MFSFTHCTSNCHFLVSSARSWSVVETRRATPDHDANCSRDALKTCVELNSGKGDHDVEVTGAFTG